MKSETQRGDTTYPGATVAERMNLDVYQGLPTLNIVSFLTHVTVSHQMSASFGDLSQHYPTKNCNNAFEFSVRLCQWCFSEVGQR